MSLPLLLLCSIMEAALAPSTSSLTADAGMKVHRQIAAAASILAATAASLPEACSTVCSRLVSRVLTAAESVLDRTISAGKCEASVLQPAEAAVLCGAFCVLQAVMGAAAPESSDASWQDVGLSNLAVRSLNLLQMLEFPPGRPSRCSMMHA